MEEFLASFGITILQLTGIFNIIAGVMLIASLGFFFGGGIYYLAYLGLPRRIDGTEYMLTGVRVLFALIVMLGVVRFIQSHVNLTITVLLIALAALVIWGLFFIGSAKPEEEEHDGPPRRGNA